MAQEIDQTDLSYRIRTAGYADLDTVVMLWGEMMDEHERNDPRIRLSDAALPSYRSYVAYHINNSNSRVFVAERGGRLSGFCLLTVTHNLKMFLPDRYGYLSDLYVSPEARRRGVGRGMVERGLAWLRERDVASVQLQFYQFNRNGEVFWRALGFEPYYTRMWRDIPQGE